MFSDCNSALLSSTLELMILARETLRSLRRPEMPVLDLLVVCIFLLTFLGLRLQVVRCYRHCSLDYMTILGSM